jgi:two-component system chemotaxis response regulator CheB
MSASPLSRRAHPAPIRVVVVDDSAVARGFIARWIKSSDDVELVGVAVNGFEALSLIPSVDPDIVLLDIEMPQMNGLEALPLIRLAAPRVGVIILTRLMRRTGEIGAHCRDAGAMDVLAKPRADGGAALLHDFRTELLDRIRAVARRGEAAALPLNDGWPAPDVGPRPLSALTPRAIVVGASTGGPNACADLLAAMKPLLRRVPVVIAQHMPPLFTRVFAESLARAADAPCREAVHGEALRPGQIVIGPGGHHVTLAGTADRPTLAVDERAPVRFSRPSVDLLFESACALFGGQVAAVVLSGMGSDGLAGARALAAAGAPVYVQDRASSVVWGMPGAIARAGLAQGAMPPAAIGAALCALVRPEAA